MLVHTKLLFTSTLSHVFFFACSEQPPFNCFILFSAYDNIADLLIENGAKLDALMHNGVTALMLACEHVSQNQCKVCFTDASDLMGARQIE